MKYILFILSITVLFSCKNNTQESPTSIKLKEGFWRATLDIQDNEEIPFIFKVNNSKSLTIYNAEERIEVDEIIITGDSIRIQTPVFEGYFAGRFRESGNRITGSFIKPSLDRVVPFKMVYDSNERFEDHYKTRDDKPPYIDVAGGWETVFSASNPEDRYIAKGIFKQNGNIVTGTFRTTTGDYRYLEGIMNGNEMRLSTFDGAHAFLFVAKVTDSTMQGQFYSGNHWKEPFESVKNDKYELPDEKTLTYLKEGYDRFDFEFPDTAGKLISLKDDRFKDKVVIVQILGSWCPNCLEESKFFREYLKENPHNDIEFVGLAFEYAKTETKAKESIQRLIDRLKLPYPILLAQYGEGADKQKAQEKLPMLNHVLSYPTSIYIDKKGEVRRIHTGFNGAATGDTFIEYTKEFNMFIDELLTE